MARILPIEIHELPEELLDEPPTFATNEDGQVLKKSTLLYLWTESNRVFVSCCRL